MKRTFKYIIAGLLFSSGIFLIYLGGTMWGIILILIGIHYL